MISPLIQWLLPGILAVYILSKVRGRASGCRLHCSASDDGHRERDECAVASYAVHSAAQHTHAQLNANESEQLSGVWVTKLRSNCDVCFSPQPFSGEY